MRENRHVFCVGLFRVGWEAEHLTCASGHSALSRGAADKKRRHSDGMECNWFRRAVNGGQLLAGPAGGNHLPVD